MQVKQQRRNSIEIWIYLVNVNGIQFAPVPLNVIDVVLYKTEFPNPHIRILNDHIIIPVVVVNTN